MTIARAFAIRAALAPAALAVLYAGLVLATGRVEADDLARVAGAHLGRFLTGAPLLLFVALLAGIAHTLRHGGRAEPLAHLRGLVRARWDEDRLLSVALPPLLLAGMLASFSTFKQAVLPLAGFGMDAPLAAADRLLFLGTDPWRITHAILPSAEAARLIDLGYMLWFVPLLLGVLLSFIADLRLRTQFLLAFVLTWALLGSVLALLLPSAGPCYYATFHGGADFAALMETLARHDGALRAAGGEGLLALRGQSELLAGYQGQRLMAAGGISAMPSLHNAFAIVFACAAFRIHRIAGWAMTAFAALILFGSVHLGWHYALDGIVGGALALLIWRLAGTLADALLGASRRGGGLPHPALATG